MGLLRRLAEMALLLLVLSLILFALLHLAPGASTEAVLLQSGEVSTEDAVRIARLRGEDRPILVRYGCWLFGRDDDGNGCAFWPGRGLLHGDLGYSRVHKLPVADLLARRLAITLRITVPAFLGAIFLSVALALFGGRRPGSRLDRAVDRLALAGISTPAHWIAMLAILVFAVDLRWLPPSGVDDPRDPGAWGAIRHAILPIAVLCFLYTCFFTRYARSAVAEVMAQDHVRMARAKGLPERRVMLQHVMRGALVPVVTVIAQSLPAVFGGALVVERAFSYPGMGVLILESIQGDDHLVALVIFLALAALIMLATSLADALYRRLDPRLSRPAGGTEA